MCHFMSADSALDSGPLPEGRTWTRSTRQGALRRKHAVKAWVSERRARRDCQSRLSAAQNSWKLQTGYGG
eukprot:2073268-Pleurochrysis_carterae.AAC.4